jgi:hypothetical protein
MFDSLLAGMLMPRLRALIALCCLAAAAHAQVPVAVPPAVPAAPAPGFFASLGMTIKAKKEKCCQSPFGKMLATMARPLHVMTGGVLPTCCPPGPGAAALAAPGPVGTAAKIQAEEAQAKARREAVKFLATVDCHYYPEAEATLISALRCDRNECVRWEAAHALGNGCCCNKRTIEALTITVSGSEKDGNPSELSFRVRAEAFAALQFCLSRQQAAPVRPETPLPPEQSLSLSAPAEKVQLTSYYANVADKPMAEVLQDAQRAIDVGRPTSSTSTSPTSGNKNLISLWKSSGIDPSEASQLPLKPTPAPGAPVVERLPAVKSPGKSPLDPPLPRAK